MSKWHNTDDIREKIACPQLGDDHYGEWGALPLVVRREIYALLELVKAMDTRIQELEDELSDEGATVDEFLKVFRELPQDTKEMVLREVIKEMTPHYV